MSYWRETDESVVFDECELVAETPRALRVFFDHGVEHWIPKSQIRSVDMTMPGDVGRIEITHWVARKKGLAD